MDQPLWQTLFNIALIGFVVRHAAVGLALQSSRSQPVLWGVYVALCAVCAFAAIAILFSRRWVIAGISSLLVAYAATTFIELGIGIGAPPLYLVAQLLFAILAGVVLIVMAIRTPPEPSHR
jgi:hypothetical protein